MRGVTKITAYDILPVAMVSVEPRDLALEVGRFGRAASLYNLLSQCEAFGLGAEEARSLIDGMLAVVRRWREFFTERGVDAMGIEMLEQAMLPACFFHRSHLRRYEGRGRHKGVTGLGVPRATLAISARSKPLCLRPASSARAVPSDLCCLSHAKPSTQGPEGLLGRRHRVALASFVEPPCRLAMVLFDLPGQLVADGPRRLDLAPHAG